MKKYKYKLCKHPSQYSKMTTYTKNKRYNVYTQREENYQYVAKK